MAANNIVYLFGTGATQGEIDTAGTGGRVLMRDINREVYNLSKEASGPYSKLTSDLAVQPEDLDIEQMISLSEDIYGDEDGDFKELEKELRQLFHKAVINNLTKGGSYIKPKLCSTLFKLHKMYPNEIGQQGEVLKAILTVNFDTVLDRAIIEAYGGINYGIDADYANYSMRKA